jgi:hypothetical protein
MSTAWVLGFAAGGSLVVWIAFVAAATFVTRAAQPEPLPAALELGGDEPPAIVNFLTNGWRSRGEAVPATLVDLAARKVVSFEQTEPDRFQVRLRPDAMQRSDVTAYERQVLEAVDQLASDGVVPCEALTTGTEQQSNKWYKRFATSVVKDARRRGLSRPRWGRPITITVTALALSTAALAGSAAVAATAENSKDDVPIGAVAGIGFVVVSVLMGAFRSLQAERDTPRGMAAAARWLGLRENLAADGTFPDLPPTAVAVWDRYLAYGVAFGLAASTAHTLHLGAESDHEAWSSVTGTWRLVRVEYPRRIPPGWGRPPWRTVATGLLQLAIAAGLVWLAVIVAADADTQTLELRDENQWIALGVTVGLMTLGVALVVGVLRALVMVVLGLSDLGRGRILEGRVLRVRATKGPNDTTIIRWALDDGTRDEIRAWAGGPMVPRQGGQVRAVVSPRLGYVRAIDPLDGFTIVVPPGASPSAALNVVAPPLSAGLAPLLDTAPLAADS